MAILILCNEVGSRLIDLSCCTDDICVDNAVVVLTNTQTAAVIARVRFDSQQDACRAAGYLKSAQLDNDRNKEFRMITMAELKNVVASWPKSMSIANAIANAMIGQESPSGQKYQPLSV